MNKTLCKLCRIHKTPDVYGVCDVCRDKAAKDWLGYRYRVAEIENPQPARVAVVRDEPNDADFVKEMGWVQ